MSFWKRLRGVDEPPAPVKVAVVGEGPEADWLAAAYWTRPEVELVGAELLKPGDGVIRQPVVKVPALARLEELVRTPGLAAVELVAPPEDRAAIAAVCLRAGLFVSVEPPLELPALRELERLAQAYRVPLRLRLHPLYYPPYREVRRLVDEDAVGLPLTLKLAARRGQGTVLPDPLDPADWMARHELGFLALAPWLLGPIAKVHARLEAKVNHGAHASAAIMWKHQRRHLYGYFQLDFCPELHVRTFHAPVARQIEITAVGGLILASRGEGQLLRLPALMVRGKSTTTAFELVPDDWNEVYKNLAAETVAIARKGVAPEAGPAVAADALRLLAAAKRSAAKGDEVLYD